MIQLELFNEAGTWVCTVAAPGHYTTFNGPSKWGVLNDACNYVVENNLAAMWSELPSRSSLWFTEQPTGNRIGQIARNQTREASRAIASGNAGFGHSDQRLARLELRLEGIEGLIHDLTAAIRGEGNTAESARNLARSGARELQPA